MKYLALLLLVILLDNPSIYAQKEALKQAQTLFDNNQYQEVVILLESKRTNFPKSKDILTLLGNSYLKTNQYDEAIDVFSALVELNKESGNNFYLLGEANLQALMNNSNFFKMGPYASATKSALQKALELKPEHIEARIQLSNYYLNAPMIAGGSTKKAKKHAEILKKYNPLKGRLLLASIHIKKGDYTDAEKIYLDMLNEGIEHNKTYYLLSLVKFNMKDYKASMDYAEQSIESFPEYITSYYQFGKSSFYANLETDKALKRLQFYIDSEKEPSNPRNHWAYLRMGEIYRSQGDKTAAKVALEKALKLKPDFDAAKKILQEL